MASWEEFSRIVAEAKSAKKLDPVNHEDSDPDNDGNPNDPNDKYIMKRRAAIGAAIASDRKKKVEESYDDLDEAKVDKKLPEHERSGARLKRYDNPSGALALGGGQQRARRAEHQARRGKPKRWWDDDGDGIGWEKGEVKKEEVEQISEIAPLVAAGLAAGGAALAGAAINRAKKAADSGVTAANKGQNIKNPGTGIAGAAYGMQRRNNALRDAMKQLNQSYQPEGEMVEEDKEYRREMAKAAARERAEERREKGGKAAKSPGRKGPSAGKSYADKEELSIKGHDEVTKKAKHTVGNPFPEHHMVDGEYIEEMPYQVYGSHDGKTEKKIGKPVKSRKYAHDRADELSDTHKETGGKFRVQKEENDLDEGMTMKDFKQQRSRQKQKDKRETEKTSPLRRAGIHDDKASPERAARHRANVDPDYDHDDEENMYPGGKLKDPKKIRKAKAVGELTKEEYIEEKALSRAQQRFMGMVYAAKKGGTPASPEVAKAAEGMSKKAARDFAKTKHEGLPEKKEDVKESMSLVEKILDEALKGTIAGGKSRAKKYKIQAKDVRIKQIGSAALSGDKKQVKKLKKANENPTLKITEKGSVPKKSEEERKEAAKKEVKRGKSDPSANVRSGIVRGVIELKKEKEKTKRQRERQEYEKERRAEKKAQKEAESKEKQEKLEASMKEKRIKAAQDQSDKEEARKQKTKGKVKDAVVGALKSIKAPQAVSDKAKGSTGATIDSHIDSVGSAVSAVGKATRRVIAAKWKERNERKQEQKRTERHEKIRQEMSKEEFSNWREEFIFEVDDQSVQNEKQKVIDVSKKKNKIEINPNMSEGCGCEEKEEKKETPQKDMRDLPTKVNLLKTKARAMGARNPIVMVASEETDNIQEIAPLLAGVARLAGGAVARGVTSRVAGSAAQGTLRSKAAQFIGKKTGEKIATMFTTPPESNQSTPSGEEEPLFQTKLEKQLKTEGAAWTKKEGKSEAGGLNEKGRKSYERENPGSDLKAPSKKVGNPRRASFCARMSGMKAKLTSKKTANDPDSRINKSLRAWNC